MGDAEDRDEGRDDKDEEREENGEEREEKGEDDRDPAREEAIRQGKDDAARRAEGYEADQPDEDPEEDEDDDSPAASKDDKRDDDGATDDEPKGARRAPDDDEDEDDEKKGGKKKWVFAAIAGLLIVVVAAVVLMGGDEKKPKEPTTTTQRQPVEGPIIGGAAVDKRYQGLEQDGFALGDADAPVTLVMFGDLQCPLCRDSVENAVPPLVDRYVKTGRLRLEFRNYAILGPDSEKAAKALEAAAAEKRAWQFIELFYLNQGEENSGYVTDDFIRRVGKSAKLPDVETLVVASNAEGAGQSVGEAKSEAKEFGIDSAPAFLIGPTGKQLAQLQITSPEDPGQDTQAVDRLLVEQDVEGATD
jgi:protein-disulfide isomerase